uniref:Copper transport protein n=1 Tax=Calidris pygmaea TaxID=425635 RepID=A0A8C3K9J2_9CHAR
MMTFYFSDTVVLLFDFWSVHTPTGRLSPSVAAPSLEGFKARLDGAWSNLVWWEVSLPRAGGGTGWALRWFRYHVGQTLFHVVQVVLGYMVMLAVMSYNAWIFLGAIAGSTLGYFVVYPLLGRG